MEPSDDECYGAIAHFSPPAGLSGGEESSEPWASPPDVGLEPSRKATSPDAVVLTVSNEPLASPPDIGLEPSSMATPPDAGVRTVSSEPLASPPDVGPEPSSSTLSHEDTSPRQKQTNTHSLAIDIGSPPGRSQ